MAMAKKAKSFGHAVKELFESPKPQKEESRPEDEMTGTFGLKKRKEKWQPKPEDAKAVEILKKFKRDVISENVNRAHVLIDEGIEPTAENLKFKVAVIKKACRIVKLNGALSSCLYTFASYSATKEAKESAMKDLEAAIVLSPEKLAANLEDAKTANLIAKDTARGLETKEGKEFKEKLDAALDEKKELGGKKPEEKKEEFPPLQP